MKTITAQDALNLDITEHKLNCEFKEIRINGDYCATVGINRAIPSFEWLFQPFVDLANAIQVEFKPTVELQKTKFGCEGARWIISMPYKTIDLGGRETGTQAVCAGSFNSSLSFLFGFEATVFACENGQFFWESKETAFAKFSKEFEGNSSTRIASIAQGFDALQMRYIQLAKQMAETHLSAKQVKSRIEKLYKGDSKQAIRTRETVLDLFVSGIGNKGETAFDLYNAITEYENHHKTYKETATVSALENRRKGVMDLDMAQLAKAVL